MRKKALCLALIIILSFTLFACGGEDVQREPNENQIKDAAGRIVDLPGSPESATFASVYAVAVPIVTALGINDRALAINPKSNFWREADENLGKAGTIGRGVVDLEALAKYNPTVLIHRSNDPKTLEAVSKIGVDVICITVENVDDIKATLRLLGRYFGVSDRAEEVIGFLEAKYLKIDEIVKKIPDNERKTAMLMGGEIGRVSGMDMLQTWMIEKAGGKVVVDVAKNHNWVNVDVEKIFEYNPEVIFCTSSTAREYEIDELIGDRAWSEVKAVKTKDIYVIPSDYDSWDMPGISAYLGVMFMLHKMYPSYFGADEMQAEIDEYYEYMFGRTFDREYLKYELD